MKIGTHNGSFHCDEVLAISMLRLLPEFKDATLVRSRDMQVLNTCDVVVDVGYVYDPSRLRFDHHQPSFNEYFSENHTVTRLSSAGAVYKHFGKRIIKEIYGVTDEEDINDVYEAVYQRLIESVDAEDNGVPIANAPQNYAVNTALSARIGRMNPSWVDTNADVFQLFLDAMEVAIAEFDYHVNNYIRVHLAAKPKFLEVYKNRLQVHESGLVIETPRGMPFLHYLHRMEEAEQIPAEKRLAFYMNYEVATQQWRATCIGDSKHKFSCRMRFPERLSGLKDAELQKASGIPGLQFIHRAGFTCGGATKESILQLISLTINES
uniref:Putative secreted protein n=1 Tax=Amblyomma aureolatum TaxID=187763 RepID=A0A1E1XHJ2_9ACAR